MTSTATRSTVPIEALRVIACQVPTDRPESDGTLAWDKTTIVIVQASAAGQVGLGYTYADLATAHFIEDHLRDIVEGSDAFSVGQQWHRMVVAIRNLGRPGVVSMAIAAVDNALWDLKARILGEPLVRLLGQVRPGIPVYGSGGFTSYPMDELTRQMKGWAEAGITAVKMKVGRHPDHDIQRVRAVRDVLGKNVALFVDANGAYDRKQAMHMADAFKELDVRWFEEPVSSDDLEGLRLIRDHAPAGMEITAGEYGYDLFYFKRMLAAGAVDVLQADITRCAGLSEFFRVSALCDAYDIPLSSHTAPAEHLHAACALTRVRDQEYFYDHVRIENSFFEGVTRPVQGILYPDLSRPGNGLTLKETEVERYAIHP